MMQRQYTCKYCGKVFSSPQSLSGHIGGAHSQRGKVILTLDDIKEAIEWLKKQHGPSYKFFAGYVMLPYIIKLKKEVERLEKELEEYEEETEGED